MDEMHVQLQFSGFYWIWANEKKIDAKNYIEINCFDKKDLTFQIKCTFIHWKISNLHRSIHTHTLTCMQASDALIHFKPSISLFQNLLHCPMCHKLSSEKETPSVAIKMLSVTIQMDEPNVRCSNAEECVCNIDDENSLKDKILFIL